MTIGPAQATRADKALLCLFQALLSCRPALEQEPTVLDSLVVNMRAHLPDFDLSNSTFEPADIDGYLSALAQTALDAFVGGEDDKSGTVAASSQPLRAAAEAFANATERSVEADALRAVEAVAKRVGLVDFDGPGDGGAAAAAGAGGGAAGGFFSAGSGILSLSSSGEAPSRQRYQLALARLENSILAAEDEILALEQAIVDLGGGGGGGQVDPASLHAVIHRHHEAVSNWLAEAKRTVGDLNSRAPSYGNFSKTVQANLDHLHTRYISATLLSSDPAWEKVSAAWGALSSSFLRVDKAALVASKSSEKALVEAAAAVHALLLRRHGVKGRMPAPSPGVVRGAGAGAGGGGDAPPSARGVGPPVDDRPSAEAENFPGQMADADGAASADAGANSGHTAAEADGGGGRGKRARHGPTIFEPTETLRQRGAAAQRYVAAPSADPSAAVSSAPAVPRAAATVPPVAAAAASAAATAAASGGSSRSVSEAAVRSLAAGTDAVEPAVWRAAWAAACPSSSPPPATALSHASRASRFVIAALPDGTERKGGGVSPFSLPLSVSLLPEMFIPEGYSAAASFASIVLMRPVLVSSLHHVTTRAGPLLDLATVARGAILLGGEGTSAAAAAGGGQRDPNEILRGPTIESILKRVAGPGACVVMEFRGLFDFVSSPLTAQVREVRVVAEGRPESRYSGARDEQGAGLLRVSTKNPDILQRIAGARRSSSAAVMSRDAREPPAVVDCAVWIGDEAPFDGRKSAKAVRLTELLAADTWSWRDVSYGTRGAPVAEAVTSIFVDPPAVLCIDAERAPDVEISAPVHLSYKSPLSTAKYIVTAVAVMETVSASVGVGAGAGAGARARGGAGTASSVWSCFVRGPERWYFCASGRSVPELRPDCTLLQLPMVLQNARMFVYERM